MNTQLHDVLRAPGHTSGHATAVQVPESLPVLLLRPVPMTRLPGWMLLLAFMLVAGCAVVPPERQPPRDAPERMPEHTQERAPEQPMPEAEREQEREPEQRARPAPDSAPEPAPDTAAPAVVALLGQADQASAAGEHDRAAALLERALRIEPGNPGLWHNLAVVRYREGDYVQAEGMAMRSIRFADGRRALMVRNWQLIAVSRELAGDKAGAEEARRRARELDEGTRT